MPGDSRLSAGLAGVAGVAGRLLLVAAALAPTGLVSAALAAPAAPSNWREASPVLSAPAMAPNLAPASDGLLLTWLETLPAGGHALRFARWREGAGSPSWTRPATIAEGPDFFANWADFPAAAQAGDGSLIAHWLAKTGDGKYAYGIHLARSTDGGATWAPLGLLHDDKVQAEHGFVSFVPEGKGLRAFWLDGRATADGGAMGLRTAPIGGAGGGVGRSDLLDPRVCDCCQTGAAVAAGGPLVVYRDRDDAEIRDMSIVRRIGMGWSAPANVHPDKWRIPGCPVNGPAVAANGKQVAIAWFTDAAPNTRVQVAFSNDGGLTFGAPAVVDGVSPLGRVGLVLSGSGAESSAIVSWLAAAGDGAEIRVRRVGASGAASPPIVLASTTQARASGVPRIAVAGDSLWATWVEGDGRLRTGRLRVDSLPR